jgi:endothelin-converting enzyme
MRELLQVRQLVMSPLNKFYSTDISYLDNGWLKQNPLPADKGSFGNFNALAKQNKDVIRSILESDGTPSLAEVSSYDAQILGKLRGMYSSCMDEKRLNKIGEAPLKNLVKTIKELYAGKDLDLPPAEKRVVGRTAALAFLHSRGVPALFSFEIEGDAGRGKP